MTVMDEAERRHLIETLRSDEQFRADVRREVLTEELLNLPQAAAALVDAVAQQRQDFTAMAQSVANYMQQSLSAIRDVVTEMDSGFARMDSGFARMDSGFAGMDSGFTAVNAKFDQVDAELRDIKDQRAS